jgi:hypothetical protein
MLSGRGCEDCERRGTICWQVSGKFQWRENERAYGNATVAADDGDDDVRCGSGLANYFGDEGGGADDIESGHTENPAES